MRFQFAFLIAAAGIVAAGCNSGSQASADNTSGPKTTVKHLEKLGIKDVVEGKGETVGPGDEVWVRYTGKLADGTVFDSNEKKPETFHVTVGMGSVIKGWDQGLVGMKLGGKRHLEIPYSLGYADHDMGKIKPFSDLFFDVELVDMLKAKDADVVSASDVKEGTGREAKKGDTVSVEYEAKANGAVQETTKDLGKPLSFKIGADQTNVRGFDLALVGMKVGGERTVRVPPGLTMTLQNEKLRANVVTYSVHLVSIK